MVYHTSDILLLTSDIVSMPASSFFIKSKETVPSAANWILVMDLPMNLRPSAAAVKSVAAGDDLSVRLLLTTSVVGSV